MGDYIFRYRLEPPENRGHIRSEDRLTAMVEALLMSLLDVLIPCADEREVRVDGFKMLNDRSTIYELYGRQQSQAVNDLAACAQHAESEKKTFPNRAGYQNIKNAALYMPVIELIKKQLESILSVVELESGGKPVKVDGFRLKDLNDWVLPSPCNPSEVIDHAGTRCNCDCVYCYNKGAPPSLALRFPDRTAAEEFEEIKTRIKYFKPEVNKSLFPGLGSTCEVLAHPHIMEIFTALRNKTDKPFRVITNGAALTEQNILQLEELKPVYLDISLNSSDPVRRQKLMRDRRPQVAINALPLLKSAGIPYSVVIVPWPLETEKEMLDDLENTVAYAAAHDTHLVQISLPGYTRYFSAKELFDRELLWSSIVARVKELRGKYNCPVVVMPGMYEESISREVKNIAEVIGVIKNSPADFAGVKQGDIIKVIAGSVIRNRPQAREMLSILQQSEMKSVPVVVQRGNQEIRLEIDTAAYSYPYSRLTDTHLGFVFMGTGLRVSYLEKLKEIIVSRGAKDVLFLSSELVKPVFEQCLRDSLYFSDINLEIGVPESRFFGGNIFMGDLLVVEDFISHINDHIRKSGKKPDLVVIPSSPFNLSQWGRDLTGRCYLDIEREVGVPVELLECNTIYD